ncbi:MAG TPA: UvrB/UvrC motif-containing protein [Bacilli bacterium]
MICQECGKKSATLHFTKIINNEKSEFHICEVCAREKGEVIPGTTNSFSIHNLLSGLLDFEPSSGKVIGSTPEAARCEECGLTYTQFAKLGRFGCSSCYKHFFDRLEPLLKRVHGSTIHVGKIPRRTGGKIKHKREIDILKRDLQRKIEQEEFESAAQIRDQIKDLEKKLNGN